VAEAVNRWKHTLDVKDLWDDDEMGLPEKGKAIAGRIRAMPFWGKDDGGDLEQIVEELEDAAEADDERWFDLVWDAFYDWADAERVWVKTAF
jgi:hypothetical protein